MLWDVGQGGVFEMHVLLVVIRFDNCTLSIGSIPDCKCQLPDEPALVPGRLHAMDQNNSMKRVDGSGHADHRIFVSDYLIPSSTVDNFKDDVVTCPGVKNKSSSLLPQGHENEIIGQLPIPLAKAQLMSFSKRVASFLLVDIRSLKL